MGEFTIRDLNKAYDVQGDKIIALQNVTLDIAEAEFVSIVGASGSGKSTLLNLAAGFEKPTSGTILFNGNPVSGPGPDRGVVFQHSALYPWLTVRKNVAFGPSLARNRKRTARVNIEEIIERVGLSAFADALPVQLSGGMRQRAAIASVLAIDPQVLLMDEPFGALDSLTRSLMQDFLLELLDAERKTVLFVTHDIQEAIYLADKVVVMAGHPGRVREIVPVNLLRPRTLAVQGSPEFIALREQVTAAVRDEVSKASAAEMHQFEGSVP